MFTRWALLPPSSLGDEGASVWTPLILCPAHQPLFRAGRDMSGKAHHARAQAVSCTASPNELLPHVTVGESGMNIPAARRQSACEGGTHSTWVCHWLPRLFSKILTFSVKAFSFLPDPCIWKKIKKSGWNSEGRTSSPGSVPKCVSGWGRVASGAAW